MGDVELPNASALPDLEELHLQLDRLWIDYLSFLDQYEVAQANIKANLSRGFFSLAQANSRASASKRYGADWYDERMKARRCVRVGESSLKDESSTQVRPSILVNMQDIDGSALSSSDDTKDAEVDKEPQQEPSPPPTPSSKDVPSSKDEDAETDQSNASAEKKDLASSDPLKWFGILVPQELRRAQASFSTVISNDIATTDGHDSASPAVVQAVNSARALRELEAEIRKLRKVIRKIEKGTTSS